ncbi:MAG: hypothetical protein LJE94_07805 [Deltaproteobacteria bacterium]|nr:hypothetical protein [Deltaproteobacteria bacterium]
MKMILYAFSLLFIVSGVCMILYTESFRNLFRQLLQLGLRALAVIACIAGLLFLLAASASHYPWFLRAVGLLSLAEAVLLFVNPKDIMGKIYAWFLEGASDQTYRASGIITVIFGTALISWIA